MPGMKLYEVADALRALDAVIEEQGGEITDEQCEILDEQTEDFNGKVCSIAALIDEHEAAASVLKERIDRWTVLKRSHDRQAESWKTYILRCMESAGIDKVSDSNISIARQKSSSRSIAWTGDPDDIPPQFQRIKTEVSFDKTTALQAWDAGVIDDYADRIEIKQSYHLRIR